MQSKIVTKITGLHYRPSYVTVPVTHTASTPEKNGHQKKGQRCNQMITVGKQNLQTLEVAAEALDTG